MMYQKLIHDYLNGDLEPHEERRLFDGLAVHAEWREELAFQLRMQNTVQKDVIAITLPPEVTASVFARAGFALPSNILPRPSLKTKVSKILKSLRTSNVAISVASVSAVALVGVTLILNSSRNSPGHAGGQLVGKMPVLGAARIADDSANHDSRTGVLPVPASSQPDRSAARTAEIPREPDASPKLTGESVIEDVSRPVVIEKKPSHMNYLTTSNIIGVSDKGMIQQSLDGGKSWVKLSSPTRNDLSGVDFLDTLHGAAVGASGTILLTNDAGRNWSTVESGTNVDLSDLKFLTRDTLFACGAGGTILRSITGGRVWEALHSGTGEILLSVNFRNGREGSVYGAHSLVLSTRDAGMTWK